LNWGELKLENLRVHAKTEALRKADKSRQMVACSNYNGKSAYTELHVLLSMIL